MPQKYMLVFLFKGLFVLLSFVFAFFWFESQALHFVIFSFTDFDDCADVRVTD